MSEEARLTNDRFKAHENSVRVKIISGIVAVIVIIAVIMLILAFTVWRTKPSGPSYELHKHVEASNIMGHLNGLYNISSQYNGSRAVQFGYNASAEFVVAKLEGAGFDVYRQHFTVPVYTELSRPILQQTEPFSLTYVWGTDFIGTRYGGQSSGTVASQVFIVTGFGCSVTDYEHASEARIAIVYNNATACNLTPYDKALLAQQAGVSALLVANSAGVTTLSNWRVRSLDWVNETVTPLIEIPVLSISNTLANLWRQQNSTELSVAITINVEVVMQPTYNVFGLTPQGTRTDIVVAGAHLDGVPEGPGINDNGSGSSSLLEIALQLAGANMPLTNKVLFAWWGAEEIGLLGSRFFVRSLLDNSNEDFGLSEIALDLNFDMLASPNYVMSVHNASTINNTVSLNASIKIQKIFEEYLILNNVTYGYSGMTGGSDYLPFLDAGIPAGGLDTGAGGIKSTAQRSKYGGLANAAFDPCYHQACDTIDNINQVAIGTLAKSAAYVIQQLGQRSDLYEFLWDRKRNETTTF